MKRISFSRKLFLVLVIMVLIDCICGDTLNSLIKRRKKIKRKPQITRESVDKQSVANKEEQAEVTLPKEEPVEVAVPKEEIVTKDDKPDPSVSVNHTSEIKYISLVDSNESDIKALASEIAEEQIAKVEKTVKARPPKVEAKPPKVGVKPPKVESKPQKVIVKPPRVEVRPPKEEVNKERIVKEWMAYRVGVPVDYSYNETASKDGDIVSAPGCPKSIDGYPWVLHDAPSSSEIKCYLVGYHSNVCQGSAVMNYQRGSDFGVCACNFQDCLLKRGLPLNPTSIDLSNGNQLKRRNGLPGKLRYRFCRPMGVTCEEFVYDQKEKRCDIMYTQGPCKANEWLQRNGKGGVECAQRLCDLGSGLTEKSEQFQRSHGNVTEESAECCRPWGSFAVTGVITNTNNLNCEAGQVYSETLKKCMRPFQTSGLTVG